MKIDLNEFAKYDLTKDEISCLMSIIKKVKSFKEPSIFERILKKKRLV